MPKEIIVMNDIHMSRFEKGLKKLYQNSALWCTRDMYREIAKEYFASDSSELISELKRLAEKFSNNVLIVTRSIIEDFLEDDDLEKLYIYCDSDEEVDKVRNLVDEIYLERA